MSESTFSADLDALVRGEAVTSADELTRFVSDLYGEEQSVTMPQALKMRIAGDLGLHQTDDQEMAAPVSRRTMRVTQASPRSSRPWAIAFAVAAAMLLALTGVLRWGMPTGTDDGDNRFLLASPAVPTVSATPAATPNSEIDWTMPISAEECPENELISRDEWFQVRTARSATYTEVIPRTDEPYSEPSIADTEAVVIRHRQIYACIQVHNQVNSDTLPVESARRGWEDSVEVADYREDIELDRFQRSKALSAYVENHLGLTPDDLVHRTNGETGFIWEPSHAIQLADGRIALLPGGAVSSDESLPSFGDFAPVWIQEDGEWRLDEHLFFCIGDCDEFWEQREGIFSTDATPEASPAADSGWMQPITPEECVIEDPGELPQATGHEFDAFPPREYAVVGPADPTDAFAANETARQYMACGYPASLVSDRYAIENSLAGETFSPFSVVMLDRQFTNGIDLSAQVQELGVTPADTVIEFDTEVSDEEYFIPNPTLAFMLDDGRILIMSIHVSDTAASSMGTTLILVQDDGEWKIDDQVPVCIGACDDVWSHLETLYADALWLSPIAAEECETNAYLPAELSDEQSAAIRSRQYRACEMSGDAQPMQGPEFRMTETEAAQPLSEEIEALHRQNGQTPGSLQRVANVQAIPMMEVSDEPWTAFQPHSVVTLEDGRIAVLQSTVTTPEIISGSGRTSPVVTTALVWIVDGDDWLLDEEVTVCLGNCSAFWGADDEIVQATPAALIVPEVCDVGGMFAADFTSHAHMPIGLRPGPGNRSGISVATISSKTPLQYLCESAESTNLDADRMEEGQVWLKVRTPDGTEGWIREMDVQMIPPDDPAATPAEQLEWLQSITPIECSIDSDAIGAEEFTGDYAPRSYEFVGPADASIAEPAAKLMRQTEACETYGTLQSDRYQDELAFLEHGFSIERIAYTDNMLTHSIVLSEIYADELGLEPDDVAFWVGRDNPTAYGYTDATQFIPSPEHAVALSDGRIVVPMLYVTFDERADSGPRYIPITMLPAHVLVEQDGEWRIDETLYICLGECTSGFHSMEQAFADGAWLHPVEPIECNLLREIPGEFPEEYQVAIRSRQYRACEMTGEEQHLQEPEYRVSAGSDAESVSDEILGQLHDHGDAASYINRAVSDRVLTDLGLPFESTAYFDPNGVVQLTDGRFAAVETTTVPFNTDEPGASPTVEHDNYITTTALIWVHDGDDWLLDEELTVCFGTCDSFWAEADIAACEVNGFVADYEINANGPVNMRPEPGIADNDAIAAIDPGTRLMWLCESEPTSDPESDQLEEGQVWMLFRTEAGTEGWLREIDVREYDPGETEQLPEIQPVDAVNPMPTTATSDGTEQVPPIEPVAPTEIPVG